MINKLCITFSGGETSGYMTQWILNNKPERYKEVKVIFANTGEENEETLAFVDKCDRHFNFGVTWLEAKVNDAHGKGTSFSVMSYETASRKGEPFEAVISKFGVPNQKFMICTRELKLRPIQAYIKSLGWKKDEYETAIGIRIDEVDRVNQRSLIDEYLVYPLIHWNKKTKPDINTWWASQPFRLGLKGYQGNCKWCWKKSFRKHMTIMSEHPEYYDFPERMEAMYGGIGPEFRKKDNPATEGYRRRFFRSNLSTTDMRKMHSELDKSFVPADDDAQVFNPNLDVGAGCEESCEVFAEEDMKEENDI
jgi:hypothetical protein